MINIPATRPPATGSSAYITSKIAQVKLLEHVAAETPDVFVVSVHPGIVKTAILDNSQLHTKDFLFDDGKFRPIEAKSWNIGICGC